MLQVLYAMYLFHRYDSILIVAVSLCPQLMCMTAILISVTAPLYYFLTKTAFVAIAFVKICEYFDDLFPETFWNEDFKTIYIVSIEILKRSKWFLRDLMAAFAFSFYCFCIMIDIYRLTPSEILTLSYLTRFIGEWCTSIVIVAGLSAMFGFLSHLIIGLSRLLVTGQKVAVYDVNVGFLFNFTMYGLCLEAGVLSVDDDIRIQNFKVVILLTVYVILMQVWYMAEQQFYIIANSEEIRSTFAYFRILLFVFTITSLPTLILFKSATYLNLDVWVLLNVSGTFILFSRAICSLIELFLGTLLWHVDNHIDKVEDTIFFTSLFKNVSTSVATLIMGFYRLTASFSQGLILFRLTVIVFEVICVTWQTVYRDLVTFQNRRAFLHRLEAIPDATAEQLRNFNDVCSICFAQINEGKGLSCSHIFHKACLRKWFQLRTVCPLCNTIVF